MKRTFIAISIEPGEELNRAFKDMKDILKDESVKWVDMRQLHITLAFIGNTSEQSIPDISAMLGSRCGNFGRFELLIRGIGIFRTISDPKVIWAGLSETGRLSELCGLIREGLEESGIGLEDRQFKPHLTLGRIRSVRDQKLLKRIINIYGDKVFQKGNVTELIYYESILQQTGPLYIPLKRIKI
jgi:2'-5' RNA ligase